MGTNHLYQLCLVLVSMSQIFIPPLGEYLKLEENWTFILDWKDTTNDRFDFICKEADISGANYKELEPSIKSICFDNHPYYYKH